MALTLPYQQHNYMGEHVEDDAALLWIRANKWDDAGDGTGNPQNGMLYYATNTHQFRGYKNGSWVPMNSPLDWQESVLDRWDPTGGLPLVPVAGDRYLAIATGSGWTIDHIYEYDGDSWLDTAPDEGMALWVEDENTIYTYNGTNWVTMGSVLQHNNLLGLQGGQVGPPKEYYHFTAAEHTAHTTGVDASVYHDHDSIYPRESNGAGNPNGAIAGAIGDLYVDTTNDIPYINVDGTNTGWQVI